MSEDGTWELVSVTNRIWGRSFVLQFHNPF